MLSRLSSVVLSFLLALLLASWFTPAAFGQCPSGTITILADRDNTLYEDPSGMLSNGAGDFLFTGRTSQVSNPVRRGLVHFDVAGSLTSGLTITHARLQLTVDQPQDHGLQSISLHAVDADWGEAGSIASMGQGAGAIPMAGDATWLDTFFGTSTWTSPGGDFDPRSSAVMTVNSGSDGDYTVSSSAMAADVQSWLDTPSTNFGWALLGLESSGTTAVRFATRENTGDEPTLCVRTCGGATPCSIFDDGFESGDTNLWDLTVP